MFGNTLFMKTKKKRYVFKQIFLFTDSLLFSALIILSFHIIIDYVKHPVTFVFFLLGICGIVLAVRIKCIKRNMRICEENKKKQERTDRLIMKSDQSLSELFGKDRFILIRKQNPDRFDLLEAIQKGADGVGVMKKQTEFTDLIHTYAPQTTLYDVDEMLRLIDPSYAEEDKRSKFKVFRRMHINKYLLLGVILIIASFVLRYKIYFRIISGICLIFAAITGSFGYSDIRKKRMLFLDNSAD